MPRAKVFRNIDRGPRWLGLEPFDALLLAVVLWVLLTFCRSTLTIDALVLSIAYVGLRIAKRGKPTGHTMALVRYAFSKKSFLSAAEPDVVGRRHPFSPTGTTLHVPDSPSQGDPDE